RSARLSMVPVDVTVHLILGEQQRLERGQRFLLNAERVFTRVRVFDNDQGVRQTIDVDLAVGNAAHERVALQVFDLVEIEGSRDEALQRTPASTANEIEYFFGSVVTNARRKE